MLVSKIIKFPTCKSLSHLYTNIVQFFPHCYLSLSNNVCFEALLCGEVPVCFVFLGHSSVNYQPQETRSRLSKTLDQVLRDNVAIPHYMHFTELRGVEHLARFWLEAESFRSTSWSRVRAHSLNSVKHSTLAEPVPSSEDGSELQEVIQNTANAFRQDGGRDSPVVQPERRDSSSTEAGLRPGTPSSQASSRTGTPLKVQSDSALRDLSNKLMKSKCPLNPQWVMADFPNCYGETNSFY